MTEFAKEYGTALYELCAEEGLADGILREMQILSRCFRERSAHITCSDKRNFHFLSSPV